MNKKILIFVLIIITIVVSSMTIYGKNNNIKNSKSGKVIDVDLLKNQKNLATKKDNYKDPSKKVVLDVKWGDEENEFKMTSYQEAPDTDVSYGVPASYAIDDKGNVYVYDTLNTKIKVFQNNKLINSIFIKKDEKIVEVRKGEFINTKTRHVLKDMAVDSYGNIYATSRYMFCHRIYLNGSISSLKSYCCVSDGN